jgi:hypothetical protein
MTATLPDPKSAELPEELFPELAASLRPPSGEMAALGALSQIAPGVWVSGMPAFELPSHVLCRLVPVPGEPGKYMLEPDGDYPGYVRMGDDIGRRLGVIGLSTTTMHRLLWSGLVDHIRPAPGCIFISVESLLEHFKNTANDCAEEKSYWTAKRRALWKSTCEGISNWKNEPE